jgi:sugar O-acyltransferase (sialic acid O-acetyltransferase NeuD family)
VKLVLVGAGGHASDVLAVLEAMGFRDVVGLVADTPIDMRRFKGRAVEPLGLISDLPDIGATHYLIAVGYSAPRKSVAGRIAALNLEPFTAIHPQAVVHPSVTVGAGTVVMAGAVISPMASLGRHVCVHHNCVIGHDCQISDFATVLPTASVSGDTALGEACLVGSGSVIREKVCIGANAVVGAGAIVLADVPSGATVLGSPARPRRT